MINFDEWADLFKTDPAEFERKRASVIEAEIMKSPVSNRHKLRIIQMECDAIRSAMSPLDATAHMTKLMINKVFDIQDAFLDLGSAIQDFKTQ